MRNRDWENLDFSNYCAVFNAAGIVHQSKRHVPKEKYFEVNANLASRIAWKAKMEGVRQYIYMSSIAVFGLEGSLSNNQTINSSTPLNPNTMYGESKLEGEKQLQQISDKTFKVAIIRAPMIYGHGCPGNYRKLRKLAMHAYLFPQMYNQRSMIYIENLCNYIEALIAEEKDGIFYPANRAPVNTFDMVNKIRIAHAKKTQASTQLGKLIRALGNRNHLAKKMLGNLVIAEELRRNDPENYCDMDFQKTIEITESRRASK